MARLRSIEINDDNTEEGMAEVIGVYTREYHQRQGDDKDQITRHAISGHLSYEDAKALAKRYASAAGIKCPVDMVYLASISGKKEKA